MSEKSRWAPINLLANLMAVIGLFVLGMGGGLIGYDQFRHWNDPDFVAEKRARHDFFCFEQSSSDVIAVENRLLVLQADVEILLDVARQDLSPTDFIGKVKRFALCAEFTGVSAGGIGFAGPAFDRQLLRFDNINNEAVDNPVLKRRSEIATLHALVPDFPPDIFDLIDVKLGQMQREFEFLRPASVAANVTAPSTPTSGPSRPNSDAYLLIVGADKTESAAINQYGITQRIVEDAGPIGESGPPEIYRIGTWENLAIPFSTKAAANAALGALEKTLPYGGYVRERAGWCEKPTVGQSFALNGEDIRRTICDG